MQVSVEALSKVERRLTVVVPAEKLNEAYDKQIASFAKKAKVDGFRAGKVPLTIIKQRYGDAARQEALSEVIQSSLYAAIHQEKLNPVSTPSVEPKMIGPDQPLEFTATFEVFPEIESVQFQLPTLEKQVATITEADIDTVLTHLREQHVVWQPVDRAAQEKDQAVIDFSGSIDGELFPGGQAHDYPIVLGSKSMIPGFEEGILGMKAGEEKVITVNFPDNYFAKEVAGKAAEFTIKLIKVSQPELPEVNESFANKLGVKSAGVDGLRAEIRKNLERELDRVIKTKLKNQVFAKLIEQNALDIPKVLIEREAKRIHDEVHPHHKGHAHDHSEEEMAKFNEAAHRNVSLGLLIGSLVKLHNIVPDKQRIQAQLSLIAAAYENPAEVESWYMKDKRAYSELEMQVLEEQVLEKLLEQVTVNETTLSYHELVSS